VRVTIELDARIGAVELGDVLVVERIWVLSHLVLTTKLLIWSLNSSAKIFYLSGEQLIIIIVSMSCFSYSSLHVFPLSKQFLFEGI